MRSEIRQLASWAPLPHDDEWEQAAVEQLEVDVQRALECQPLDTEEVLALLPLLMQTSDDGGYGLSETLQSLVESNGFREWQPWAPWADDRWLGELYRSWMYTLHIDPTSSDGSVG